MSIVTNDRNYGSFPTTQTHSSSPRATISSLLDIKQHRNASIYSADTDTDTDTNDDHLLLIPPAAVPYIHVLTRNACNVESITNQSKSSLSAADIDGINGDLSDMSHHIEKHGLVAMMHGTPHHGEAHEQHLQHIGSSPIRRVIFNMLNCIIGAGVVGLPFVYSTAGLFGGLLLMVFFAFISAYSLKLLIISAKCCQQKNYEDLCEYLFGYKGYLFVSVTMLLFDFGATLSYLIILGDSASQIISIFGFTSNTDRRCAIAIVSVLIILPTVLPRDLSKIEKVSAFSVFSVILIMLVVIYEWIALQLDVYEGGTAKHINIKWGVHLEGFPMAIGIIAFAFVCHDSSFLLYNTLKDPSIARWSMLAYGGCLSAVIICACFAVPGYLTFGSGVSDNILNNYDTYNPLIIAARCIYCITMALTYPCSFFVVRHVCYAMFHHGPNYESILSAPLWKHLLFTIPLFFANLLMGIFVQNLGIVMSVSGSLSAVVLAFVLPTMCYLKICKYKICFWNEEGKYRKWRAFKTTMPPALLWLFGVCVAIFSTSFTIIQHLKN